MHNYPMCPKSDEFALKILFTPVSRMSSGSHADTTQEQKGAEQNHTLNANLKIFIAIALVSYIS